MYNVCTGKAKCMKLPMEQHSKLTRGKCKTKGIYDVFYGVMCFMMLFMICFILKMMLFVFHDLYMMCFMIYD